MAFAEAALETGDRVVLTSRRPEELASWADQYGDRVLVVPLDVTDPEQVSRRWRRPRSSSVASMCWSTTPAAGGSDR